MPLKRMERLFCFATSSICPGLRASTVPSILWIVPERSFALIFRQMCCGATAAAGCAFKPLTSSNLRGGSSHKQKENDCLPDGCSFGLPRHSLFWRLSGADIGQLRGMETGRRHPRRLHISGGSVARFYYLPDLCAPSPLWGVRSADLHWPAGGSAAHGHADGLQRRRRIRPAAQPDLFQQGNLQHRGVYVPQGTDGGA